MIPTVGDANNSENGLCDELAATLPVKQISDLLAELSSHAHIQVDHIQEVHLMCGLSLGKTKDIG